MGLAKIFDILNMEILYQNLIKKTKPTIDQVLTDVFY